MTAPPVRLVKLPLAHLVDPTVNGWVFVCVRHVLKVQMLKTPMLRVKRERQRKIHEQETSNWTCLGE